MKLLIKCWCGFFILLSSLLIAEEYPSLKALVWNRNPTMQQAIVEREWQGFDPVDPLLGVQSLPADEPLPGSHFTLEDGTEVWVSYPSTMDKQCADHFFRHADKAMLAALPAIEDLDYFDAKVGLILCVDGKFLGLQVVKIKAGHNPLQLDGAACRDHSRCTLCKLLDAPLARTTSYFIDPSHFRLPEVTCFGKPCVQLADAYLSKAGAAKAANPGFYVLVSSKAEPGVWTAEHAPFVRHILRLRTDYSDNRRLIDGIE